MKCWELGQMLATEGIKGNGKYRVGVSPFFLARGLKRARWRKSADPGFFGRESLRTVPKLSYQARLVGRHQAFQFLEPVEDDDQFRRHQILITLYH